MTTPNLTTSPASTPSIPDAQCIDCGWKGEDPLGIRVCEICGRPDEEPDGTQHEGDCPDCKRAVWWVPKCPDCAGRCDFLYAK